MAKKHRAVLYVIALFAFVCSLIQLPINSSIDRAILKRINLTENEVPRQPTGKVDFIKLIDDMHYAEANRNVLAGVTAIMGTDLAVNSLQHKRFYKRIGISDQIDRLEEVTNYFTASLDGTSNARPNVDEIAQKLNQSWTEDDYPAAHEWLMDNNELIDRLALASHRPKFYHPYIRQNEKDFFYAVLLPGVQAMRNAARVLRYRANFELGRGNVDAAINDQAAIHKLGVKTQSGATLVEQLVGIAIIGISFELLEDILSVPKLNHQNLKQLRESNRCCDFPTLAHSVKHVEGWAMLDLIQNVQSYEANETSGMDFSDDMGYLSYPLIFSRFTNWELAIAELNYWNDKAHAVCLIPNDRQRLDALQEWENETQTLADNLQNSSLTSIRALAGARSRGYLAGELLGSTALPNLPSVAIANVRGKVQMDLAQVGLAIEQYFITNKSYPSTLAELTPNFMALLPIDRYTNKPLDFAKTQTHYLIASRGYDQVSQIEIHLVNTDELAITTDDIVLKVRLKK